MAQRKTLTESQVGVLRWIGDGCPDGVMKDDFHRISAAALARRGLVHIDGRREDWSAQITDVGRAYLKKVDGPEPPIPRQGNTSVTQQFVDEVIDAGGSLRVPRRHWGGDNVDYENRALLAERHRKVPPGKRLAVKAISSEELEIELLDAPGLGEAKLVEIEVPERVTRYHPAAKRFRGAKEQHHVSRAQLARAARIIHALARETERRDWSLQSVGDPTDESGRAVLRIDVSGQTFSLFIYEKGVDSRGVWEAEVERHRRNVSEWPRFSGEPPARSYDVDAEGELTIALASERAWRFRARQSRWSDRSSWTLEERLPHLFAEIEERAIEGARIDEEERRVAEAEAARQEREKTEREAQWKKLMVRAQDRVIESHRAAHLRSQLDARDEAERIRRYCEAMDATAKDDEETAVWLTWVRDYAKKIDPIGVPTSLPEDPELTHEAVQQHLPPGWSTYGPEHGWQPRPRMSQTW